VTDRQVGPDDNAAGSVAGTLTSSDFAAFFRDVHGYEPFPWQQRLTSQVLERGMWPKVIDLPTGTGKTAVLDTAVFAMALQPTASPRRVVFVIDRRIVVDQVHIRAKRIRDRIGGGETPILQQVRERLRRLSGGVDIGVAALRGGVPVDIEWAQRPDQPWVLVTTVDQFGSRLLFRGYGVTAGMRPIHAGLAGNDCLVILDEVHLSVPFAETLDHVAELHSGSLPRRFAVVQMSATPSDKDAEKFTLDSATDLHGCEELRRRVEAAKVAKLDSARNEDALPPTVLKIIKSIGKSSDDDMRHIRSVGVVVNRVRTARETYDRLLHEGYSAHLITGRMRPIDRINSLQRVGPVVDPDRNEDSGELGELDIVVSTQAIEVGADFSFDAMITECAAVDSLRQRFGRLDRRGSHNHQTGNPARAWIIGTKSVVSSKKPDPVYGNAARLTWERLKALEGRGPLAATADAATGIDVGPTALRDFPDGATAPRCQAPLLLKTHMDAWTQTRPEPLVQPTVDWFLHGIDEERSADVAIVWRWDRSYETLRLVPPRQAEFLEVPIAAAKSWLSSAAEVEVADVPQPNERLDGVPTASQNDHWVRWAGIGEEPQRVAVGEIRPGDILVVDPKFGGLTAGTWDPSSKEDVHDLGDAAQVAYGRRATLRLDSRLFDDNEPPKPAEEAGSDTPVARRIRLWLNRILATSQLNDWVRASIDELGDNYTTTTVGTNDDDVDAAYYVLTENHDTRKPVLDTATIDGSDESNSFTGTGVPLDAHLAGVGDRAAQTAERLGMLPAIVEDIRLAGRLHDLGKVDRRFQLQLVGGDPVGLELRRNEPLAKSLGVPTMNRRNSASQREQPYPKGMRHELASVALIESNRDVLGPAYDTDLVLHLVGTHHGWARPMPPIIKDPEPQTLRYESDGLSMEANSDLTDGPLALDMAERFWRLTDRYGHHGLAWLEAILRLADHQQSAEEAKQK